MFIYPYSYQAHKERIERILKEAEFERLARTAEAEKQPAKRIKKVSAAILQIFSSLRS